MKIKKILGTIMLLALMTYLLAIPTIVNAAETTDGKYEYSIKTDNTIEITKYKKSETVVTIPSTINGKLVTSIGNRAFYDCDVLETIIIPDSVTSMGNDIFSWCDALKNVTLSNNLTSIGNGVFYTCTSLESIIIPNSVTSMGNDIFSWCDALKNVTLSNNLTSIGSGVFYNCTSLESIIIPDSVKIMGDSIFSECSSLESVTLPYSLESIKHASFLNCKITSIEIPNNVEVIEYDAFRGCTLLRKLTIFSENITFGENVFLDTANELTIYGESGSTSEVYANSNTKTFIPLLELEASWISDIVTTKYYSGNPLTQTIVVTDGVKIFEEGIDYKVYYLNNDKAGIGTVEIVGRGDYVGKVTKNFSILKQPYTITVNNVVGATINPNGKIEVLYGEDKEIVITANEGYKIISILVDGVEKISTLNKNVLTISNLIKNTEITIVTEKIEEKIIEPIKDETPKTGLQNNNIYFINIIGIIVLLRIIFMKKSYLSNLVLKFLYFPK